MKFAKGIAMGALVTAGVLMMTSDDVKKKAMKKGRQMMKKVRASM